MVVADNDVKYLKFILGILNSKLFDFVYKSVSKDKKSFQRIILDNVKKLPLPPLETYKSNVISLVDNILNAKKSNPQADTSKQEQEIDFLVYKLYGLTYDEVLIVDPETAITREEYEKQ